VSVTLVDGLVAPHGGVLVDRLSSAPPGFDCLETVTATPRELADLDLISVGALSPLEGFMGRESYASVLETMRLPDGLPWSLPVCLSVPAPPRSDTVAIVDARGVRLAVVEVEDVFEYDVREEAQLCFRTTDGAHPGVARLYRQHRFYLAGRVTVFVRFGSPFPELDLDPAAMRAEFVQRGWRRVVAFQTRNPIHRAHEHLTKIALETVDGLLIHPIVGETKDDDVPAETRVACYRALIDHYYPGGRVLLAAFPAAMRYAGPREAVWHAICRKNYGCSHFIVGRDHAGVGSYYGSYDAQHIFSAFDPDELGIEPVFFEHSFYCLACGGMATSKTCPHDDTQRLALSGTTVRRMLCASELPPREYSRPEIAAILARSYGATAAA